MSNDIKIDWGDGATEEITDIKPSHEYKKNGIYDIKILGTSITWSFADVPDNKNNITQIKQWGYISFGGISFAECENLSGNIPNSNENNFKNLRSFWKSFSRMQKNRNNL